jgi:polyphosphate kinase 2 (PPK2 family)
MIDEMRTEHAEEINLTLPPPRLAEADLRLRADPATYKKSLRELQEQIGDIPRRLKTAGQSLIVVFEGWDASGKGGCIRRLTDALREDRFQVFATAAPNEEEKARHYLWRFWRTFPPVGSIAIYDRSWYGRVLVERVEGFATEEQWSRAYGEICEMEESLTREGAILCKFWLEISPEEQLRRFEARLSDPQKRWKLTGEDWRNRSKREEYLAAAEDMFSLTDTTAAPWTIIPAEDKKYARLAVLRHILRTVPGK